jgi:hypothetical protein
MIGFVLLMLVQPAGQNPYDVAVPNAIVGQHNRYVACQDEQLDMARVRDPASFRAEVERAISACASSKAALKEEAEAILARSPEFADAARRQAAMTEAFDGYDRVRRLMGAGSPR